MDFAMRNYSTRIFDTLAAVVIAASCTAASGAAADCAGSADLRLVHGKIHTFDARDTIVSEVVIENGRFASPGTKPGPCTKTIDLRGRTAVPGLIDNHNHIVLLGLRPGHDLRIETAASISDVQAAIRAKAKSVPAGEFITAMGGWNPQQFAEKRLPTLAELDAADTNHPVLVYQAFAGPAATNTAGKAFFAAHNVAVSGDGRIEANAPSLAALNALRSVQTFEDKKRGTLDAMAYAASNGITTSVDMGAFVIPGLPDIQDSFTFDGLASQDPFHMYDAFLALHREGKMSMRLRLFFLTMDTQLDIPILRQRLLNTFAGLGDSTLKVSGIGEFATAWQIYGQFKGPANYATALRAIAKAGWPFQQHTLSLAEDQFTASTFEAVNQETPIADLRWSIAHTPHIDRATVNRLKAIGAGIAVHPYEYLGATASPAGPPLRMILDSGIHVGAGSDSAQISTLNPWLMIYYMVTGKNSAGVLVNPGQQITRQEALRLYTAANGWFFHEETQLGTIEPGKLGDVVVLNEDYFDSKAVPDEAIKRIRPDITILGGKIVYQRMP
jgi:predicted amidohydrolase YtcJ